MYRSVIHGSNTDAQVSNTAIELGKVTVATPTTTTLICLGTGTTYSGVQVSNKHRCRNEFITQVYNYI